MLRLVPFAAEQHLTERYVSWLNDPETVRYSEQRHRQHSLISCGAYAASVLAPSAFLAIELDHGEHIGNVTIAVDAPNSVADISILIGEKHHRGRGLGKSAWMEALMWCWDHDIELVTAGTMTLNAPMIALMQHSGMTTCLVEAPVFAVDGGRVGMVKAWKERPKGWEPKAGTGR